VPRPGFEQADFLAAALAIAAEHGPSAATVASITERLKAPVGSFYYRFSSRDLLLGELWLQTVLAFQEGITAALDAGDALAASLHTPAWVREHLDEARLLLLYHRNDFGQPRWPQHLRDGVAAQTRQIETGIAKFANLVFGREGVDELRRAQFLLAEVPVAAVRQHLLRREPPPSLVDDLIRVTYHAVIADYRLHSG
jgi:AcrR family transcriptional regulator